MKRPAWSKSGTTNKRSRNTLRRHSRSTRSRLRSNSALEMEQLEPLTMLAPVYPDLFAWADQSRGYLYDYVIEGDLLRFTTALANQGDGHLEIRGGAALPNGNQEVIQRIFNEDGSVFEDRLAGEFTYHPGHGHIHFDGYATYNLRERTAGDGVGDIVASGGKVSFCLIDISNYNSSGSSNYHSCGQVQGISAGWSDVYGRGLSNQWINIAGVADGDYWLEIIVDPDDQLVESDETNNTTRIPLSINGGPAGDGDRYEPNDTFLAATNMGIVAQRQEAAISIHDASDVDYFEFVAAEDGDFEIHVEFTHALGNLDAFIYDSAQQLVTSGTSVTDLEDLHWEAIGGETYYLLVIGANGETNGYELDFHGPGNLITETVSSSNVPIQIPDSPGSSTPGVTVTSTLQGPDISLSDLNLIFDDLDHTYMGDLHFELTSPAGTTAVILTSTWESGGGLLGSGDNFTGTFLDDQAPTNLGNGTAPYTGSFNIQHANAGNNPLSVFNGESALGTWTVSITDWFSSDTGVLNAWSIMFTGLDNNPGDALEQNDAFPQATWLGELGISQVADLSIHNSQDEDFFRFMAAARGVADVDIGFLHSSGNLDVIVYDQNLVEIARGDSTTDNESLSFVVNTDEIYYVRVLGVSGDTNDYGLTINTPTAVFETGGLIGVNHNWQFVPFAREYADPVVLVSPATLVDGDPVTTRIRNVTSTGFEVQLDEWDYQDGTHASESIGFMVVEAGTHTLDDGTVLQAGRNSNVGNIWDKASYGSSFSSTPVVFTQIEADHNTALVARVIDSEIQAFAVRVQSQEDSPQTATANVHWIGVEARVGSSGSTQFETGFVEGVNSTPGSYSFAAPFTQSPIVFAGLQSAKEMDPVSIRFTNLPTSTQFSFQLAEEESGDSETTHSEEQIGYMAFAPVASLRWVTLSTPLDEAVSLPQSLIESADWFEKTEIAGDALLLANHSHSISHSDVGIDQQSRISVQSALELPAQVKNIDVVFSGDRTQIESDSVAKKAQYQVGQKVDRSLESLDAVFAGELLEFKL